MNTNTLLPFTSLSNIIFNFTRFKKKSLALLYLLLLEYSSYLEMIRNKKLHKTILKINMVDLVESRIIFEPQKSMALNYSHINSLVKINKYLIAGSCKDFILIWDLRDGVIIKTLYLDDIGEKINCLVKMNDSQIISGNNKSIIIWDIKNGTQLKKILVNWEIQKFIKIDEYRLAILRYNIISVLNLQTELLYKLEGHTGNIAALVKVDKNTLITSGEDLTVRIWDLENPKCIQVLDECHSDDIWYLERLSKILFATGSNDSLIKIWKLNKKSNNDDKFNLDDEIICLRTLQGHDDSVLCIIKINGHQLVSSSVDKTIKLWDYSIGTCLKTFTGHKHLVSIVIKINNKQIVSSSMDQTVRIRDLFY